MGLILFCFGSVLLCVLKSGGWAQEEPDGMWGLGEGGCWRPVFASPNPDVGTQDYPPWRASDLWASVPRSKIRILGLQGAKKTDGDPNLWD